MTPLIPEGEKRGKEKMEIYKKCPMCGAIIYLFARYCLRCSGL